MGNWKESEVRKEAERMGFTFHNRPTAKYRWYLKRAAFKGEIRFLTLGQVIIYLIEIREKKLDWNRVHKDLDENKTYDF